MNAIAKSLACALSLVAGIAAAQDSLRFNPPRPGQVFSPQEPVRLFLPAGATSVSIRDAWGNKIATDTLSSSTEFTVPLLGQGWYLATFDRISAGGITSTESVSFTILPPHDLSQVSASPFGVMTHFAQAWEPDLIAPLAQAGIKHVRDEIYWDAIEAEKGTFTFPQRFESYRKMLADQHLDALTPMTFGNRHYDATAGVPAYAAAPYTEEGFKGYARYAREVLRHYGAGIQSVEIWNEYNGAFARGPADGKPEVYARMLEHAYRAIKAERPDVKVLGCSTIGIPLSWIEQVFQAGGIRHMDGISVHPYGYLTPPENLAPRLQKLKALIRQYNSGRDLPIWITEQGWYLVPRGSQGNRDAITEMTKAAYLVRAWTIFLSEGVERSFWYLARNDASFGTMGLVGKPDDPHGRYAPKPALTAYATLIRQLSGLSFAERDNAPEAVHSYRFTGRDLPLRVLWATQPQNIALRSDSPLDVTDMMGRSRLVQPVGGAVHLYASEAPFYIRGQVAQITSGSIAHVSIAEATAADEASIIHLAPTTSLRNQAELRFQAAGLSATVTGPAELSLPAAGAAAEERWVPFELRRGDGVIYYGIAKSLLHPAIRLTQFPRLTSASNLSVDLISTSPTRTFALRELRCTIAGKTTAVSVAPLTVAPGQSLTINVPVEAVPDFSIIPAEVQVDIEGWKESLKVQAEISHNPVPRATRKLTIDGDLWEWAKSPAIALANAPYKKLQASHGGDRDLAGHVYVCWDSDYLYVAAAIQDDIFDQQHTGFGVWNGDNIQLGLSTSPPWTGGQWAGAASQELGLTMTPRGPEVFRFSGTGQTGVLTTVPLSVRRTGQITAYECAIPWSQITPSGKPQDLGFSLFVNDADGAGRRGYKQWADIKQLNRMQWISLQK